MGNDRWTRPWQKIAILVSVERTLASLLSSIQEDTSAWPVGALGTITETHQQITHLRKAVEERYLTTKLKT